jgi:hypothetical protein
MLNRTFSIDKNRELSPLEARLGSIRRRLKDPLEGRAFPTQLRVSHRITFLLQGKLFCGE